MAGDWIKWEKGLAEKEEVLGIARRLNMSRFEAAARCMVVWEWADSNLSRSGHACNVTRSFIDERATVTGFADAMAKEGWLLVHDDGSVEFPNFDHNLSQSAKARGVTAKRKQRERAKASRSRHGGSVTKVGPEKRREELTDNAGALSEPEAKRTRKRTPRDDLFDAVVAEWFDQPDTLTKSDRSRIGKIATDLAHTMLTSAGEDQRMSRLPTQRPQMKHSLRLLCSSDRFACCRARGVQR